LKKKQEKGKTFLEDRGDEGGEEKDCAHINIKKVKVAAEGKEGGQQRVGRGKKKLVGHLIFTRRGVRALGRLEDERDRDEKDHCDLRKRSESVVPKVPQKRRKGSSKKSKKSVRGLRKNSGTILALKIYEDG